VLDPTKVDEKMSEREHHRSEVFWRKLPRHFLFPNAFSLIFFVVMLSFAGVTHFKKKYPQLRKESFNWNRKRPSVKLSVRGYSKKTEASLNRVFPSVSFFLFFRVTPYLTLTKKKKKSTSLEQNTRNNKCFALPF
jgi:hypothetical protein